MMIWKVGAVKMENRNNPNIGYTASTFLIPSTINLMNPTMNSITNPTNPDHTHNPILNEVENPITGQVKVGVVNARFNLSQFNPSKPLPSFTPPPSFGLNESTFSTTSTHGSNNQIEPASHSDRSVGIVTVSGNESSAAGKSWTGHLTIKNQVAVRTEANHILPAPKPIRDFSKLNRSDVSELFQHQSLLTAHQLNLLKSAAKTTTSSPALPRRLFAAQCDFAPFKLLAQCNPILYVQRPQSRQQIGAMQASQILPLLLLP